MNNLCHYQGSGKNLARTVKEPINKLAAAELCCSAPADGSSDNDEYFQPCIENSTPDECLQETRHFQKKGHLHMVLILPPKVWILNLSIKTANSPSVTMNF